jgi:hypothetical protein
MIYNTRMHVRGTPDIHLANFQPGIGRQRVQPVFDRSRYPFPDATSHRDQGTGRGAHSNTPPAANFDRSPTPTLSNGGRCSPHHDVLANCASCYSDPHAHALIRPSDSDT